jgi:multiple sugar transport system ATP-binding protein
MQHLTSLEIDKRVREVAKMLEIENLLERKPKALSGGQRQRVAIGRAIVRNAKVFLMDEPLSNLDAKLRNQMRAELILLRKRIDTTFIYVTHDQTEAMTLGDRIVIMKDGVAQQIGTPQQLFNHPANLFVAGFIGSPQMNFIDALITEDTKLKILGKRLELHKKTTEVLQNQGIKNQNIVLGIRPEHLMLTTKNDENALEGVVSVVELMGSSMHVHIETETNKNVVMIVPITNYDSNIYNEIVAGEKIYFSWNKGLEHLFSKETEENLIKFE